MMCVGYIHTVYFYRKVKVIKSNKKNVRDEINIEKLQVLGAATLNGCVEDVAEKIGRWIKFQGQGRPNKK